MAYYTLGFPTANILSLSLFFKEVPFMSFYSEKRSFLSLSFRYFTDILSPIKSYYRCRHVTEQYCRSREKMDDRKVISIFGERGGERNII